MLTKLPADIGITSVRKEPTEEEEEEEIAWRGLGEVAWLAPESAKEERKATKIPMEYVLAKFEQLEGALIYEQCLVSNRRFSVVIEHSPPPPFSCFTRA